MPPEFPPVGPDASLAEALTAAYGTRSPEEILVRVFAEALVDLKEFTGPDYDECLVNAVRRCVGPLVNLDRDHPDWFNQNRVSFAAATTQELADGYGFTPR
jgi:hypothetical protein